MLVFIDETGDPGFKLEKGSSANFALAPLPFLTICCHFLLNG